MRAPGQGSSWSSIFRALLSANKCETKSTAPRLGVYEHLEHENRFTALSAWAGFGSQGAHKRESLQAAINHFTSKDPTKLGLQSAEQDFGSQHLLAAHGTQQLSNFPHMAVYTDTWR